MQCIPNACGLYHGVFDSLFERGVLETTRICVSVILDFERSVNIIVKESKYRKVSQTSDKGGLDQLKLNTICGLILRRVCVGLPMAGVRRT